MSYKNKVEILHEKVPIAGIIDTSCEEKHRVKGVI